MAEAPPPQPRAGVDYPRNLIEFGEFFPDDKACMAYLERLRWAEGFVCPEGHVAAAAWRSERGLSVCPTCRRQVSATAGTIFEGTRKLRRWFLAAWEVTSQKYGASALGLKRTLGLGSYETAWAWQHKLRRAMVRPDRDQLSGDVEVDETYLGQEEPGVTGRRTINRAIVVIAVEMNEGKIGRIRLRQVQKRQRHEPPRLHRRRREAGQPDPYRWLAGLRQHREQGLPPSRHCDEDVV